MTTSWVSGGLTTWTHDFANQLARRGHEVTCVVVQLKWSLLRQPPLFQDTKYRLIWLKASPLLYLTALPRFVSAQLHHQRPQIIVSTEAEATYLPPVRTARSSPVHVPVVHIPDPKRVDFKNLILDLVRMPQSLLRGAFGRTVSRQQVVDGLTPLYWSGIQYLGRRRVERAGLAVCVSDSQRRAVESAWRVPSSQTSVIYNGIDTSTFRPLASQTHKDGRRLLFVGGANPRKGVDVLLEAFALVHRHYPDAILDLVGGWNWGTERERANRLGVASQVRFHSFIPYHEMPGIYARASLFVSPTRSESFGRAIAEAMACAVPVISTRAGATHEVVDHGVSGLLLPSHDPHALSSAVIELLTDPSRAAEMGRAGRRRIERHFAWDVIIPDWERLFGDLLGDPDRPARARNQ